MNEKSQNEPEQWRQGLQAGLALVLQYCCGMVVVHGTVGHSGMGCTGHTLGLRSSPMATNVPPAYPRCLSGEAGSAARQQVCAPRQPMPARAELLG